MVLEGVVGDGDHHKPQGADSHQLAQHVTDQGHDTQGATAGELQQGFEVALYGDPYQQAEQADLEQGFDKLHQVFDGEDLLGPFHRVDLLDVRLDRLTA